MRYQLVLQWPSGTSSADYDKLLETEELLAEGLSSDSEVDGHDAGSGEVNIFILTNDPPRSFDQIKLIIEKREVWRSMRVAYRERSGTKYSILWPVGLKDFKVA
jgi:hypothetical protein